MTSELVSCWGSHPPPSLRISVPISGFHLSVYSEYFSSLETTMIKHLLGDKMNGLQRYGEVGW